MEFKIDDQVVHKLSGHTGKVVNTIHGVLDPLTVVIWNDPSPCPRLNQSTYGWDAGLILRKRSSWEDDLVLEA